MSSRFPDLVLVGVVCLTVACSGEETSLTKSSLAERQAKKRILRVCADPNNLPFSNRQQEGFEDQLARLIASEMKAELEYAWWPQRRGFVRNTLRAGKCDVILGVPSSFELALASAPYYRSSYVFVSRKERGIEISSLDDPKLRQLRIGVQLVGDDGATTPPALALARRGVVDNVKGYTVYGDYSRPLPAAHVLDAVVANEVDVALVWGPLAGFYASRSEVPLKLEPVTPEIDIPFLPMVYDISFATRRSTPELKDEIERILEKRRGDVDALLARYGVPRVDVEEPTT